MGHLLANHDKKDYREIYAAYEAKMISLLSAAPSIPRRINVLMHMMGYFSNELNQEEKQYFLNLLEEYRRGAMPLTVPMEIIRSWAIRFNNDYILSQVILQPYPKELLILSDSGKGRDLRR
jgi:uncharacterized protein YbgA (DUF1722 family)